MSSEFRGFIVHAYAERRKNRVLFAGRLEDGRSFAAADSRLEPSLLIPLTFLDRLPPHGGVVEDAGIEAFEDGAPLARLRFRSLDERAAAAGVLRKAGVPSPDADFKPAESYLIERGIRGPVLIRGSCRAGRRVDLVFADPELSPADADFRAPLRLASIDIETDEERGAVRSVALAASMGPGRPPIERVFMDDEGEAAMLRDFARELAAADPDVLTGWNFLDFDFPRLAARFEALGLSFSVGRSTESARFMVGEGRRSAAAFVPGRQVIDALRAVRAGPDRYPDYRLETVARAVLGEGKGAKPSGPFDEEDDGEGAAAVDSEALAASGAEKIAELNRLYAEDRASFAAYCLNDAVLVLKILDKTGLFRLAVERACLTGVTLDKAWTSVASFERVYAAELRARNVAPAALDPGRRVSGAAGGTVLDPAPSLFRNVAVFDFRSLYPTIIRTFNIDPLAHERARFSAAAPASAAPCIEAPNGARFLRAEPGAAAARVAILPGLIADYFDARRAALDAGDQTAAFVYKILMNSFYGVLGSGTCRYARTELAGAITSFARKWLHFSRDFFSARGLRVLYGDTDSLFMETGLDEGASYTDFAAFGAASTRDLNMALSARVRSEYSLESFMELRFEKAYRRFLIPPLRSGASDDDQAPRGRAKGYAGLLLEADGSSRIEVKGMEAVRSDVTSLARASQLALLDIVFRDEGEAAIRAYLKETESRLRAGLLDEDLVYRKRLVRPPEAYVSAVPPQVRAARALGWKGRRGVVAYVWTAAGPEPASAPTAPLDYDHYLQSQLLPIARSIADAIGVDLDKSAQMELDW